MKFSFNLVLSMYLFSFFFNGCSYFGKQNEVARDISSFPVKYVELKSCTDNQMPKLEKFVKSQQSSASKYVLVDLQENVVGAYIVFNENNFVLQLCDSLSLPSHGSLGEKECPNIFSKWTSNSNESGRPNHNQTVIPENFTVNDSYYFKSKGESDGFINVKQHNHSKKILIAEIEGHCSSKKVQKKTIVRFVKVN